MRPLSLLLIVLTASLAPGLVAPRGASAYEHVTNGGFENGISGWIADGLTSLEVSTESARSGAAGARVEGGGRLRITAPLAGALAADRYVASIAVRPMTDATVTVRLSAGDWGQLEHAAPLLGGVWNEVSATFTIASASQASFTIVLEGASAADIDDVRLEGTPPVIITPTPTAPRAAVPTTVQTQAPSPTITSSPTPIVDIIAAHVRNPGFEEVDAAGLPFAWEKYGGVLASTGNARSGDRAAQLTSLTDSTKWVHQVVTVEAEGWYAFGAWVGTNGGVKAAFLRVSWYSSDDASGSALDTADSSAQVAGSSGYVPLTTGPVQAPRNARAARLRVMLTPSSVAEAAVVVDDVTWERTAPAPAPSPSPAAGHGDDAPVDGVSLVGGEASREGASSVATGATPGFARGGAGVMQTIVINEVHYDAMGDAPDSDLEWVELYNASDATVDIGGWSVADGRGVDVLPPLAIAPRSFAIVAASAAFEDAWETYAGPLAVLGGRIGNGLGNDGDALFLLDPSGRAVDAVSWGDNAFALNPSVGDVPEGHSIERRIAGGDSDRADDWVDNERPTPGLPHAGPQTRGGASSGRPPVEIIEATDARWPEMVPWLGVAASAGALATALAWRGFEVVRSRTRQQP